MTTLHETSGNVHYRRLPQMSNPGPSNVVNSSLDVTRRACVPCAVVGRYEAADGVNEVGTPECSAHAELASLVGAS